TPAALKRGVGGDTVILVGDAALGDDVAARYGVAVQKVGDEVHLSVHDGAGFVPTVAVDFRDRIRSIQVKQPSLDDGFLKLTGRAIREQEGTELDRMRMAGRLWTGRR